MYSYYIHIRNKCKGLSSTIDKLNDFSTGNACQHCYLGVTLDEFKKIFRCDT